MEHSPTSATGTGSWSGTSMMRRPKVP
jgi:hypothetical protein